MGGRSYHVVYLNCFGHQCEALDDLDTVAKQNAPAQEQKQVATFNFRDSAIQYRDSLISQRFDAIVRREVMGGRNYYAVYLNCIGHQCGARDDLDTWAKLNNPLQKQKQIGAFIDLGNAVKFRDALIEYGYDAIVLEDLIRGKKYHVVYLVNCIGYDCELNDEFDPLLINKAVSVQQKQVAVFSDEGNAISLRDKLESLGYDPIIRQKKVSRKQFSAVYLKECNGDLSSMSIFNEGGKILAGNIFYEKDLYDPPACAKLFLKSLSEIITKKKYRISIKGHADLSGDFRHNMGLSRRRVMDIKGYLIEHGVSHKSILVGYSGEALDSCNERSIHGCKVLNRRVSFVLY